MDVKKKLNIQVIFFKKRCRLLLPIRSAILKRFLTKDVSKIHTGLEGGFRGWGQSDTSWVYQWYKVSKNVFGKAVLSLVAEFQK